MAIKQELEKALTDLVAAVDPLLMLLRRSGECCLCHVSNGTQHADSCPVLAAVVAQEKAKDIWR